MAARRWPLVGRDAECDAIIDALDADPAHGVVLAGPAGVGRTRLLREAMVSAQLRGRPVHWAAASRMSAPVPLGALAPLISPDTAVAGPLGLLQRAARSIAGDRTGPRPVLAVDDAHFLDPLSATLVHQLATAGAVTVLLTIRTALSSPDPCAHLWKDELATRLDVQPLRRHQAEHLICLVLDGDVDSRTGERLWRLTEGHPQVLREVLEEGMRNGQLQRRGGLWRWVGTMVPSPRLAEIVLDECGELEDAEWAGLQALATAQPLPLREVAAVSSPEAVATLQRRGLVADAPEGRSGEVRIASPLLAEVVRSRASRAALQVIRHRLAADAWTSPDAVVDRCAYLLDGDLPLPDADLLVAAAQRAVARLDLPLAERLAGAAIEAGGGVRAHLALVDAAWWQGQPERSERLAVEADRAGVPDDDRARLAATRVLVLACALGRPDDAAIALRAAQADVRSDAGRAALTATEAVLAHLAGNPGEAVRLGQSVLGSPSGTAARPLAAAAAAASLAVTGRTAAALSTVCSGWTALESRPDAVAGALARILLAHAEVLALHLSGRVGELERRAAEMHQAGLAAPEWPGDAIACLHRGWAALAAGRARVALRWFGEALDDLEQRDPAGFLGLCRSLAALARAAAGDPAEECRLPLRDAAPVPPGYEHYARMVEVWRAAAEGRRAEAGSRAVAAADLSAGRGQTAVEAWVLHVALRFGADVAERLCRLSRRLDAPILEVAVRRAAAAAVGSGDGLDQASQDFEDLGTMMHAAEAAAEAAAAHERAGNRQAAAVSRSRAAALAGECQLPELLTGEAGLAVLTTREEEVAQLAAQGLTNQDIADRLVLSVRTVEAHLAHVYAKLGISGRTGLGSALARSPGTHRRGRVLGGMQALSPAREPSGLRLA